MRIIGELGLGLELASRVGGSVIWVLGVLCLDIGLDFCRIYRDFLILSFIGFCVVRDR